MSRGPLLAMRYRGGKSFSRPVGPWVAAHLPEHACLYVEPFAGMLGVMLNRTPACVEWASDANPTIVNWWTVVRDHPRELARRLSATPPSAHELDLAAEAMRSPIGNDPIEHARRVTVGFVLGMNGAPYMLSDTTVSAVRSLGVIVGRLGMLSARLANVRLRVSDATATLERLVGCLESAALLCGKGSGVVVYCDPPYPDTETGFFATDFDADGFAETALAMPSYVRMAVSGVASSWPQFDAAGWVRREMSARSTVGQRNSERVEALWMNYTPPQSSLFE